MSENVDDRLGEIFHGQDSFGWKSLTVDDEAGHNNLTNGSPYEIADEVAQLVLKGESQFLIMKALKRNFPSGVTIGNVEEMLKLVYVNTDPNNLKKAINFVQMFHPSLHEQAYTALYDDVQFNDHTNEPEVLLLQNKLRLLPTSGTALRDTKKKVDADCRKIISRIVRGIGEEDYSISIYIAEWIDIALLNDNMPAIVGEFYTPALEKTRQLLEFSRNLPYISNSCFLIDALFKELEKRQLLDSEQAMHIWAHAKYYMEEQLNWPDVQASTQKLCTDAVEKLSQHRVEFYRYYKEYVEGAPDKHKIRDLHLSNWNLQSIVCDFVSFYFNGDVERTRNLLEAAHSITYFIAVVRILSQLHEEMDKMEQLSSFEAFRLFNVVKGQFSNGNYNSRFTMIEKPLKKLKEQCPSCLQQLLWPQENTEFQLVNKFYNATLSLLEHGNVVCFSLGDKRSNQAWKITVDEETALLTLKNKQNVLKFGPENNPQTLTHPETKWMVKAVDEHHVKIFSCIEGAENFLSGDENCGNGCFLVRLRKENNTDMQLWKLQPRIVSS